jgi:hypothetical protein
MQLRGYDDEHRDGRTINLQRIYDCYPPGDQEADYLAEVARRIRGLLKDSVLDLRLSMALIRLLALGEVRFPDGFVVNDTKFLEHTIGHIEACMIISALCEDPDQPVEWWNDERLRHDAPSDSFNRFFDDLIKQIKDACPGLEVPYHRS